MSEGVDPDAPAAPEPDEHGLPLPAAEPDTAVPDESAKADADAAGDDSEGSARPRGAPSRRALTYVVVPLIVLVVASWVGDALAPTLAVENPLSLLVLSPRLRNQVLVVNQVPVLVFFIVGSLRLFAADPPFYFLGRWYGDSAVGWVEKQSPAMARFVRDSESTWRGVLYPLVFAAPNNVVCLLAGSMGMRPVIFLVLNLGGTLVRLFLIVLFGAAFEEQISWLLELIGEYRWWLVGISTLVVGVIAWRSARAGSGQLGQLRRLSKELDDEASVDDTDGDGDDGTP